MNVENIKVEAMQVFYGESLVQKQKIKISPSIVKADLDGCYFKLYAVVGGAIVVHAFWFDTTGTTVAPVVPGATLHKVDISSGSIDTAAEYATAVATAVALVSAAFASAVATGNEVLVVATVAGYAPAAEDAKQTGLETNFGFELVQQGDTELDLGCLQGDIEAAFEESFIAVTCHSEGITPVAQLKNGVSNAEVTLTLEETTTAQIKKMMTKTGGSFIPEGGSEVYGLGTYKNFENMFKFASKLRLHPVRLLPGDKSEDWTALKALPNLKGATFSGEKVFSLPVTFKIFPAPGVNNRVNYFVIGDASQSLV